MSWDTDDECSDEEDVFLFNNIDDGNDYAFINSDAESGNSDDGENNSGSDQENSPGQPPAGTTSANEIIVKSGAVWERFQSTSVGRVRAHNVFTASPGVPRAVARCIVTPYHAWKNFIHENILRKIIQYTNEEAQRRGATSFCLNLQKLEAFTGLQYARGVYGKGHPVAFLWSQKHGIPIFYETMARDSFLEILKFMRFDDKPNRVRHGPGVDKFAPIRDVFERFSSLCQCNYICDFSLTVDEQLMPCKSRCPSIMFIPNKPDKYGIKFRVLVDVSSKFISNIVSYLGAQKKGWMCRCATSGVLCYEACRTCYWKVVQHHL